MIALILTRAPRDKHPKSVTSQPPSWRSLLWRVGVGGPKTQVVREHVGLVAADLDAPEPSAAAARALGVPGLYRSPTCWGGSAPQPDGTPFEGSEWAARCQAASFEIAVPIGAPAVPFILENAFGPLEILHGVAMRALLRLSTVGSVDASTLKRAMHRIEELEPFARDEALDGLARLGVRRAGRLSDSVRRQMVEGLERLTEGAKSVRARLRVLDPLTRLDPDRARRFLPDLRRLLSRDHETALDAALLVRTLDPRDSEARDLLQYFATRHPDPKVRDALAARLKPPRPVPGGRA